VPLASSTPARVVTPLCLMPGEPETPRQRRELFAHRPQSADLLLCKRPPNCAISAAVASSTPGQPSQMFLSSSLDRFFLDVAHTDHNASPSLPSLSYKRINILTTVPRNPNSIPTSISTLPPHLEAQPAFHLPIAPSVQHKITDSCATTPASPTHSRTIKCIHKLTSHVPRFQLRLTNASRPALPHSPALLQLWCASSKLAEPPNNSLDSNPAAASKPSRKLRQTAPICCRAPLIST